MKQWQLLKKLVLLLLPTENRQNKGFKTIRICLKPEQRVFIGVIDVNNPKIERAEEVRDRILEAVRYIPVNQLGTTDDCGFTPFSDDKSTTHEIAFAKITTVLRVLPVRIHDLDSTDIKLCESLLEGTLPGVEFIYKSSGVNRPLRSKEDNPNDNLNKAFYRDQINKVANAIKEIIIGLKFESAVLIKEDIRQENSFREAYNERISVELNL